MSISSERMEKILTEETLGKKPEVHDTPEEAAFRERMKREVKRIRALGGEVAVPFEWPSSE